MIICCNCKSLVISRRRASTRGVTRGTTIWALLKRRLVFGSMTNETKWISFLHNRSSDFRICSETTITMSNGYLHCRRQDMNTTFKPWWFWCQWEPVSVHLSPTLGFLVLTSYIVFLTIWPLVKVDNFNLSCLNRQRSGITLSKSNERMGWRLHQKRWVQIRFIATIGMALHSNITIRHIVYFVRIHLPHKFVIFFEGATVSQKMDKSQDITQLSRHLMFFCKREWEQLL